MEKIKRFIDIAVPVRTCNLKCPFCYIAHNNMFLEALPNFRYSAETIGKALSKDRLGGVSLLNLCGGGETLLPPQITDIARALLEQGHFVSIVTNGTVTKRFEEICRFPEELLSRLFFKFSFHYLELARVGKFEEFWGNVRRVRDAGCSFTIELTPYDELVPHIDDIKKMCLDEVGAYCHVTVARDETDKRLPILTKYSTEEYFKIWNTFDSELFRFKMSTFDIKRKEFCYAGLWSGVLNLGTGMLRQCYCGRYIQNIFKDVDAPIKWQAIATCPEPHCHNAHVWLAFGTIIEFASAPDYSQLRNRVAADGTEWLRPNVKEFFSSRLFESNEQFSEKEQSKAKMKAAVVSAANSAALGTFRFIRKHTPKKIRISISKR